MPKAQNLRDNPHYFGTYLNMARHNAYMILSYLSDKYTDNKVISEEQLPQSAVLSLLVNSKKPDVTYKLIGDLRQHFPFLRYKEVLNERNKGTVTADAVLDLAVLLRGGTVNKKPIKPDELQPEQYAALLKSCLETLNKLRNSCSHFAPQYTGA